METIPLGDVMNAMEWKFKLTDVAGWVLDQFDPQMARRILTFLHDRVAVLDNSQHGPDAEEFQAGEVLEVLAQELPYYQQH